jgi:copper chaperone
MKSITYTSQAIHCGGCARSVTAALTRVPGVAKVDVDPDTHRVDVEFDETQADEQAIKDASSEAGFSPD